MKIAIFLGSEKMNTLDKNFVQAVIFKINDGVIVGVEKDFHVLKNINSLALWLISNEINELYVDKVEEPVKAFFEKIDIKLKNLREIKDNPILKAFIF